MAKVVLDKLEKSYGSNKILRGISATVEDGELVALLGPSGCGKTTTLRCIAGFEIPDSGVISIGDRDIVFPSAFRYRLRAEGSTGLSPKAFYEQANAEDDASSPLPDEIIRIGDVVEIDTGLAQFFFYCVNMQDFRPAFFDVKHTQTGRMDDTEVS